MRSVVLLVLTLSATASAADFNFGTMLRAGVAGGGDWEMTAGTSSGDTTQTKVEASPYYLNDSWQAFQIGFNGTAGYIRLFDGANPFGGSIFASFLAPAPVSANATWTLNSFLRATGTGFFLSPDSEVRLNNLALGAGLTVLTPLSNNNYTAQADALGSPAQTNISPIVFRSNNAGGAWMLSGQVRFDNLSAYNLFGVSGSQAQFGLTASAVSPVVATPEPATFLTCAGVLIFLGCFRRKRFTRQ